MMFNSATWLLYNFSVGSVSGVVNESLVQVILLITIYRMTHPEGMKSYYTQRIRQILWKTKRPDYDRFIFIHDRLVKYQKTL